MDVVAVVLSVDEAARLETSLPPAVAQAGDVLVVDNASTDATADVAARLGARVLRLERRVSYAAAMNAGLAAASGAGAVLLLNADCVLEDGFVEAATAALAGDGVGSVAPLLLRSTGGDEVDAAGMTIDRRRKNSLVGHGEPAARWAVARESFGADGACALYRREVLEALGPEVLDEDLGLWATDADLAWRARALGWRCVYAPAARARHVRFYSPTTRPAVPSAHRRLQFRNRLLMIVKNERRSSLLRDLPRIAAYEVLALGYALVREPSLLPAYWQAARLAPRLWRKRRRDASAPVPFGLTPPPPDTPATSRAPRPPTSTAGAAAPGARRPRPRP